MIKPKKIVYTRTKNGFGDKAKTYFLDYGDILVIEKLTLIINKRKIIRDESILRKTKRYTLTNEKFIIKKDTLYSGLNELLKGEYSQKQ